ncbi:hypothetical protein VP01_9037g1 [Puccinia sorghi]|uniref:Tet-like 2OG-Fe(II) oxygenase domain-containing protein n=1 Tax=Puccinia sorghi TaxID=27349 RepID=A0A0L6U7S1_9BASI|nr:hypothetical protein VP01_9037g1 [Puccinia sorghi]
MAQMELFCLAFLFIFTLIIFFISLNCLDDENWAKLQSHNMFLAVCMESISQMAYQQNKNLMQEYSIPNWSQDEWVEMKKDYGIEYSFASNVSVTYNVSRKKYHQDKKDINGWTYGHGFLFPQRAYLIDFAKSNGIIEILWQTTEFEYQTTQGPPSLQHRDENTCTHFGCSFQINKNLANIARKLKGAKPEHIADPTLCKKQRYGS